MAVLAGCKSQEVCELPLVLQECDLIELSYFVLSDLQAQVISSTQIGPWRRRQEER